MSLYLLLKFLHVFLAMIAVGFSGSYAVWILRSRDDPAGLVRVLAGIRFIDSRYTNPAFIGVLLAGFAMTLLSGLPLSTFWIAGALLLYVAVAAIGILVYVPAFRRLRLAAQSERLDLGEYRSALSRATVINAAAGVMVLLIVFLMVVKPMP